MCAAAMFILRSDPSGRLQELVLLEATQRCIPRKREQCTEQTDTDAGQLK
jgi:hypothetical protein